VLSCYKEHAQVDWGAAACAGLVLNAQPAPAACLSGHAKLSWPAALMLLCCCLQDVLACSGLIDAYFACAQQTAAS
jgi:hypothetical protein